MLVVLAGHRQPTVKSLQVIGSHVQPVLGRSMSQQTQPAVEATEESCRVSSKEGLGLQPFSNCSLQIQTVGCNRDQLWSSSAYSFHIASHAVSAGCHHASSDL